MYVCGVGKCGCIACMKRRSGLVRPPAHLLSKMSSSRHLVPAALTARQQASTRPGNRPTAWPVVDGLVRLASCMVVADGQLPGGMCEQIFLASFLLEYFFEHVAGEGGQTGMGLVGRIVLGYEGKSPAGFKSMVRKRRAMSGTDQALCSQCLVQTGRGGRGSKTTRFAMCII